MVFLCFYLVRFLYSFRKKYSNFAAEIIIKIFGL